MLLLYGRTEEGIGAGKPGVTGISGCCFPVLSVNSGSERFRDNRILLRPTVETYENHAAKMEHGAIDHVALDVRDIEEIFQYINEAGLNSTQDTIHFLPFWENGVKFFTIEVRTRRKWNSVSICKTEKVTEYTCIIK